MMQKPTGAGFAILTILICVLPPLSEEALFAAISTPAVAALVGPLRRSR